MIQFPTRFQSIGLSFLVISGVVMSYLSFFTPPVGEVSDSVLGYLGECLIWAGSMFGMTEYVNYKIRKQ